MRQNACLFTDVSLKCISWMRTVLFGFKFHYNFPRVANIQHQMALHQMSTSHSLNQWSSSLANIYTSFDPHDLILCLYESFGETEVRPACTIEKCFYAWCKSLYLGWHIILASVAFLWCWKGNRGNSWIIYLWITLCRNCNVHLTLPTTSETIVWGLNTCNLSSNNQHTF